MDPERSNITSMFTGVSPALRLSSAHEASGLMIPPSPPAPLAPPAGEILPAAPPIGEMLPAAPPTPPPTPAAPADAPALLPALILLSSGASLEPQAATVPRSPPNRPTDTRHIRDRHCGLFFTMKLSVVTRDQSQT